jgi:hypothetical protein
VTVERCLIGYLVWISFKSKENVRLWRKENLNLGLACHRDAYSMRAVGLCRHDAEELCIHISLYSCWVS